MTQYLPPNLLALFAPRDPIPYMLPMDKLPHEKKLPPYAGVATYLDLFEDPKDTPPPTRVETKDEKRERKRKERQEQVAYQLEQDLAMWDPANDPRIAGDPFKTLFVGRINYDTSESKLRREFEVYGPVKRLKMVYNNHNNKPRGYGFIEYEHERDMHSAYKHADGKKIDGRRVLVDVERGRTIKGWRPRRLAGGLGGTRKGGPEVNTKFSGREDSSMSRDDRSRSRERDRRRRSRSRERRRRSRSPRERKPRRSRSRERRRDRDEEGEMGNPEYAEVQVKIEGRKRHRSRSRDRERRRSRSRDRERRSRRSRSRDRKRRRSRDRGRGDNMDENGFVRVKQEQGPIYPGEDANYAMTDGNYGPMPPSGDGPQPPPPPQMPEYGNGAEYGAPPPPTNEYGSYQ